MGWIDRSIEYEYEYHFIEYEFIEYEYESSRNNRFQSSSKRGEGRHERWARGTFRNWDGMRGIFVTFVSAVFTGGSNSQTDDC